MTKKLEKFLCRDCGLPLVIEDKNGNLRWGTHEKWCPAKYPITESPARKAAKKKLVCEACKFPNSDIHDLGEIAHCKKCEYQGLAAAAVNTYVNLNGEKKPVEVIFPALRKSPKAVPLSLYTDALMRIDELEKKLKRRGK